MPAAKQSVGRRYYSAKDIMEILGVSKSKALEIMHMFEYEGKLFRTGNVLRVEIITFEKWLRESVSHRVGCAD